MQVELNPAIFREYDIRGVVDRDLTPEVAETIARAYATYLRQKQAQETQRDATRRKRRKSSSDEITAAVRRRSAMPSWAACSPAAVV